MNGSRILIDANIFLRVIVKDNEAMMEECTRVMYALERGELAAVTTHLVLAEIAWTCKRFYGMPKATVIAMERGIIGYAGLTVTDTFRTSYALSLYEQHNVKYIDAVLASHTLFSDPTARILSYDKDFDRLGIPRIEPKQLLRELKV